MPTVTEAIYDAGYNSSSRFYSKSAELLGMTPTAYRAGGAGLRIRFAVGQCAYGAILAAASAKGVCAILLGDEPEALVRAPEASFPTAELDGWVAEFGRWLAKTAGFF